MLIAALVGVLLGAVCVVIALNFTSGEKRIQRELEHRYAIDDPAVPARARDSARTAHRRRQPRRQFREWRRDLSGDAGRDPRRKRPSASRLTSTGRATSGAHFADALSERAQAGVAVHVLVDWVGSQKMEAQLIERLKTAGVEVERYHPLHWYHLARMNNRTHRKLLVVDGVVGFTGGVGIADNWDGHAADHPSTGATPTTGSKAPPSRRCRRRSWTTGSRPPARSCRAQAYFPALDAAGEASGTGIQLALRPAAATACC